MFYFYYNLMFNLFEQTQLLVITCVDCNQGKDDYSDMQDRALGMRCVRYMMRKRAVHALSALLRSWIQRVF